MLTPSDKMWHLFLCQFLAIMLGKFDGSVLFLLWLCMMVTLWVHYKLQKVEEQAEGKDPC